MSNYRDTKFTTATSLIKNWRDANHSWDSIKTVQNISFQSVQQFISQMALNITVAEWEGLVDYLHAEEDRINAAGAGIIYRRNQLNNCVIPGTDRPDSSWQKYKDRLLNVKEYPIESVNELENSIFKTLKNLSEDTTSYGAIKGMVLGSVQSGKTGHMAGLMAMAADNGWNMFVVLSGLLESLRKQTEDRFKEDLENGDNVWYYLTHPGTEECATSSDQLQLGNNRPERYISVCLKNPSRLESLINYLQEVPNKQEQMKVLIIEDEADQAGVNANNANIERQAQNVLNNLEWDNIGNTTKSALKDSLVEISINEDVVAGDTACDFLSNHLPLLNHVNRTEFKNKLFNLFYGYNDAKERSLICQSINSELHLKILSNGRTQNVVEYLKKLSSLRTRINDDLTLLVRGKKLDGDDPRHPNGDVVQYKAMNYIAYTATPFANLLNEAPSEKSLYPRDFVIPLKPSNEYFGPSQIFGYQTTQGVVYPGLDIIREVDDYEQEQLAEIHSGTSTSMNLPDTLKRSIAWFLCCAACWRFWNYTKPISMLIHTSHLTNEHDNLKIYLEAYFNNFNDQNRQDFIAYCKEVWNDESYALSKSKFRRQFPDYGKSDDQIKDYPAFDEISPYLDTLIPNGDKILNLLDNGKKKKLEYCQSGVNFCVDNSKTDFRIKYPKEGHEPSPAPAFIVLGGATLSRGLTFKGLVCSYFSREVSQLDTMLQMGRWFGYRKGYELLPRIWMTDNTKKNFTDVAEINEDLWRKIEEICVKAESPEKVGVEVKNCTKKAILTAKNKMQAAVEVSVDFTGTTNQTIMFNNNNQELNHNLSITEQLFSDLGDPSPVTSRSNNTHIWRNVDFTRTLKPYLQNFIFCRRGRAFSNVDLLIKWVEEVMRGQSLSNWNVILAGKNNPDNIFGRGTSFEIGKINRSRQRDGDPNVIDIESLISPNDILNDVDLEENANIAQDIRSASSGHKDLRSSATQNGVPMVNIPQLLIYIIDKDSRNDNNTVDRMDLQANEDIVGLYLYIPGTSSNSGRPTHLNIRLQ